MSYIPKTKAQFKEDMMKQFYEETGEPVEGEILNRLFDEGAQILVEDQDRLMAELKRENLQ